MMTGKEINKTVATGDKNVGLLEIMHTTEDLTLINVSVLAPIKILF